MSYKKIKTKIGDRMIQVDEQGRLTYPSVVEFIDSNPFVGITVHVICDGKTAYRASVGCGQFNTVEEIGEGNTATEAYELAITKAFRRALSIDLPLYNELADTEPVEQVKTVKEDAKPTPVEKPVQPEEKAVEKVEPVEEIQTPQPVEEPQSESVETVATVDNSAEIAELEQTMITIGQQLSKEPKTIKALAETELDKPTLGMIGFIARKVKSGNADNVRQADCVRRYLELKGIQY